MAPRLTDAQKAEAAQVKAKGLPGPWTAAPATPGMQRMARQGHTVGNRIPETQQPRIGQARKPSPTGGSQGNAGVIRGAPTGGRRGQGGLAHGVQEVIPAPYQEAEADRRHGGTASRIGRPFQNDGLVVYDRHLYGNTGTERQKAHPDSTRGEGMSPLADGPVRPSYGTVDRVLNPRYGTTGTRHLDHGGPFATTRGSDGRLYPLGIQDGSPWTTIPGGAPGLTHVYGVRGSAGAQGPLLGSPEDQPQKIRGGLPHGLHSPVQSTAALLKARRRGTPQIMPSRVQRPANSKVAGQSYSQTVQYQDQTTVTALPRVSSGRPPGMHGRGLNR
jgi:hypothetical protein